MGNSIVNDIAGSSRNERLVTLGIAVALHIALILILLVVRGPMQATVAKSGALSVMSLDAPQEAQSKPPPPTMPSKRIAEIVPLTSVIYSETFDRDAKLTAAGNCATLDIVVQALLADRLAVESVLNAPPEARSIADAVVIWNAGWSEAADAADAPLAPARASVEQSLSLIPDRCLDEPVAGPRLVPIPAGSGTMFLVFGSGVWTWRELVSPPLAEVDTEDFASSLEETLRRLFGN